jgi:tRNA-specific 2-thiouridylase
MEYFIAAYRRGLTPNPCVLCNRHVKFGLLLDEMKKNAPDGFFATGHYAAKVLISAPEGSLRGEERWFLREPRDLGKSQIYFLAMIEPAVLGNVLFPLAGMTVGQVRRKVAGLPLANARESQDVCFLQGEELASFLRRHLPDAFRPGDFLNAVGEKIGRHDGALGYTIGQRRGTRFASDRRLYVVGRDIAANTVILGEEKDLVHSSLAVTGPVFWRPLQTGETLTIKIRYERHGHEAEITEATAGCIRAIFKKPVRAVTPGQFAVFYDSDVIAAAGEIAAP